MGVEGHATTTRSNQVHGFYDPDWNTEEKWVNDLETVSCFIYLLLTVEKKLKNCAHRLIF